MFRLGEPVCNGIERKWVETHSAVAAVYFDALRNRPTLFDASLPGADAVGPAEYCGRGYRRWLVKGTCKLSRCVVGRLATSPFICSPGISRLRRSAKRTP